MKWYGCWVIKNNLCPNRPETENAELLFIKGNVVRAGSSVMKLF